MAAANWPGGCTLSSEIAQSGVLSLHLADMRPLMWWSFLRRTTNIHFKNLTVVPKRQITLWFFQTDKTGSMWYSVTRTCRYNTTVRRVFQGIPTFISRISQWSHRGQLPCCASNWMELTSEVEGTIIHFNNFTVPPKMPITLLWWLMAWVPGCCKNDL